MGIDDDRIAEFIRIYAEEFGETLSPGDAALRAQQLVVLYECLLGLRN
jgi:hypothetical protein